ncbi:response regulator transcription factor [Salinispira pacifica]
MALQKLPWEEMLGFLLRLEQIDDVRTFYAQAIEGLGNLVPAGAAATCITFAGGRVRCLHSPSDPVLMDRFNSYYSRIIPFPPERTLRNPRIDYREWENTEYVADLIRSAGISQSIIAPSARFAVSLHRTRFEPPFSERETGILVALTPHIESLYERLVQQEDLCMKQIRNFEAEYGRLTRRESEVLRLAALRLTNAEIATELNVSVRTVERHFMNLYDKTEIPTRWELIRTFSAAWPFGVMVS